MAPPKPQNYKIEFCSDLIISRSEHLSVVGDGDGVAGSAGDAWGHRGPSKEGGEREKTH